MTDLDRIRLEIGDTEVPMHFTDVEILEKLAQNAGNWLLAAADLLHIWAIWLAHQPDFTVGRFSESGNAAAAKVMNDKAQELQKKALLQMTSAFAGGISVSDKAARAADTDRTQADIKVGFMDNPEA